MLLTKIEYQKWKNWFTNKKPEPWETDKNYIRFGQQFINDHWRANTASDPELFYTRDDAEAEKLIFSRYIKDI